MAIKTTESTDYHVDGYVFVWGKLQLKCCIQEFKSYKRTLEQGHARVRGCKLKGYKDGYVASGFVCIDCNQSFYSLATVTK